MPKNHFFTFLIFLILYLLAISLISLKLGWQLSFFWLGVVLGFVIYQLYNLFYSLCLSSNQPPTLDLKKTFQIKKIPQLENLAIQYSLEKKNLPTNSALFQLGLVILAFFALSSTSSLVGKGLVLGLFLYSLICQGIFLFKGQSIDHWFTFISPNIPRKIQAFYFLVLLLIFLLLSFLLI